MAIRKVVIFLLMALFLCQCTSHDSERKSKVKLLLDWWPNPNHVPLFAGVKEGIFAKHGIDLDLLKVSEAPEVVPYLLSKQADIALFYMPSTLLAASKTENLRVLGVLIKEPLNVFLFREDSGIRSHLDFHKKSLGGSPDGIIEAYINSAIGFSKIHKIQMDPVSTLLFRTVDVMVGVYWNIEGEQLHSLGIPTKYVPLKTFGVPDYMELIFITRSDYLQKNPELAKNFQQALDESISFCKSKPDLAFKHYLSMQPDKDEKVISWEREAFHQTVSLYSDDQDFHKEKWRAFYEWMIDKDLLTHRVSLDILLENDPNEE